MPELKKLPKGERRSVLKRVRLISKTLNVQSYFDNRVHVIKEVHEYQDADLEIYRKSFEYKPGTEVQVPEEGTHVAINALKKQW